VERCGCPRARAAAPANRQAAAQHTRTLSLFLKDTRRHAPSPWSTSTSRRRPVTDILTACRSLTCNCDSPAAVEVGDNKESLPRIHPGLRSDPTGPIYWRLRRRSAHTPHITHHARAAPASAELRTVATPTTLLSPLGAPDEMATRISINLHSTTGARGRGYDQQCSTVDPPLERAPRALRRFTVDVTIPVGNTQFHSRCRGVLQDEPIVVVLREQSWRTHRRSAGRLACTLRS
jgi:hypothetical protein